MQEKFKVLIRQFLKTYGKGSAKDIETFIKDTPTCDGKRRKNYPDYLQIAHALRQMGAQVVGEQRDFNTKRKVFALET